MYLSPITPFTTPPRCDVLSSSCAVCLVAAWLWVTVGWMHVARQDASSPPRLTWSRTEVLRDNMDSHWQSKGAWLRYWGVYILCDGMLLKCSGFMYIIDLIKLHELCARLILLQQGLSIIRYPFLGLMKEPNARTCCSAIRFTSHPASSQRDSRWLTS